MCGSIFPRSFAAVWIRDTNLILVSSDQNCNCSGVVDEVATMNSDPIVYILSYFRSRQYNKKKIEYYELYSQLFMKVTGAF